MKYLELAKKAVWAGDLGSAFFYTEKALKKEPNDMVLTNYAYLLSSSGKYDEAIKVYTKLINEYPGPDLPYYHLWRGMDLIKKGELKQGFEDFEWRIDVIPDYQWPHTRWYGQSLNYKTLLVISDHGFGDLIQFMRYVPLLKEKYKCKVLMLVDQCMERLTYTLQGVDKVVKIGDEPIDHVDYAVMVSSLPHFMGSTTYQDIPCAIPYLSGGEWNHHLPPGKLVGICWTGSGKDRDVDKLRDMPFEFFQPLYEMPDITCISLQYGDNPLLTDFYETASLINRLDLVVSIDTAVVHLAGALGKPVWLLSKFDNCWRWRGAEEKSPWYPTLRQFRQPKWGDWTSVIGKVKDELELWWSDGQ